MAGKKALKTDAEVKAEVDLLLGQFGVVGEAEGDFAAAPLPMVKNGDAAHRSAPSGEVDALWGGKKK